MAAMERTKPETGASLLAAHDGRLDPESLASALVLRSIDGEPLPPGPPALTIEVDLPPLVRHEAPEEELAVRIDDVPVAATTVDLASVGTSSIEIAPVAAIEMSPLDARSGPYVRPIGDRTTGPTPRLPSPHPRATGPVPTAPATRATGGEFDELLRGGSSAARLLGGHVPGATQEVPRLDVPGDRQGPRAPQAGAWSRIVRVASLRRPRDA